MHDVDLLVNLSIILVVALTLGLITQRLKLSPIVGYLLAGIALGPRTPGVVADSKMASEFAEIGVVLLMFGVGLHFKLKDLLAVWRIAVPGAVGQIAVATLLGAVRLGFFGWPPTAGLILGLAISVASTVVLVRMLEDNDVLHSRTGHVAVGWLIVEDIFTVLVLVALPAIGSIAGSSVSAAPANLSAAGGAIATVAGSLGNPAASGGLSSALAMALGQMVLLVIIVLGLGQRAIPWLLAQVARTRSRELFTLAVLAIALAIATGAGVGLHVSMVLGAFLAGMVVGQTEVSHQAAADALPMRDAFAVLFFVSVGMLIDPAALWADFGLLMALLAVVLIAKPLAAFAIVWVLGYSVRTALTVAIALGQIGEFSFLLGRQAIGHGLLEAQGQSLLVACAIVSITLNPILFRLIGPTENWLRRRPGLWRVLNSRAESRGTSGNLSAQQRLSTPSASDAPVKERAVIVGYGPVGQTAARILRDFEIEAVVIDLNVDTIRSLAAQGTLAFYGDATRSDILEAAGIANAKFLLVTLPDLVTRTLVIIAAKNLNPQLKVFARARYLQERAWLQEVGASEISTEEAETALGLARLLLQAIGADADRIREESQRIRADFNRPLEP